MRKRLLPLLLLGLVAFSPATAAPQQNNTVSAPRTQAADDADIIVTQEGFHRAEGRVGSSIVFGKLKIKTVNTKSPVTFEIRGADRTHFSVSPESIPAGSSETEVNVSYDPLSIKAHKATLFVDCATLTEKSQTIRLEGIAINPATPPGFTVTPATLPAFNCEEKKQVTQVIQFTSQFLAENLTVRMAQKHVFKLSTASIYKNYPGRLVVTFAPLKAGEYKDTLIISTYGVVEQRIPVEGKATAGGGIVQKEGDELVLSANNPLKVLNETFEGLPKNKPLSLARWTNSAVQGTRAWWGYSFPDYDALPNEGAAKVTPFDSKVEHGDETPCEMLLVTPPLDFKNAASKIFTIRLRGDYLKDGQEDEFKVYYIDLDGGKINKFPIEGFKIPDTKDESGEWKEYHVDLSEQNIADVFFIGFGFKSKHGSANTATYYIDDISFGRTDLPAITPSVHKLEFSGEVNTTLRADDITVTAKNTTEPIKVTVSGRNPSKFAISTKTLPAGGGTLKITFRSDVKGIHSARIKLSSRGAADQYIDLVAYNGSTTGVERTSTEPTAATVYDLSGRKIATLNDASAAALKEQLKRGVYILRTAEGTRKVVVE